MGQGVRRTDYQMRTLPAADATRRNGFPVESGGERLYAHVGWSHGRDGWGAWMTTSKLKPTATRKAVRVWAPGCSTGEEAYSIAMLLQEQAGDVKRNVPAQMFATDIDAEAIERARAGVYPDRISADVSPDRLARFFVQDGATYRVAKTVRDCLVFAKQDVTKDPPVSRVDLISCRNLLIYMDGDLQQRLMPMLHYAINPDGYLFLGSSETVGVPPTSLPRSTRSGSCSSAGARSPCGSSCRPRRCRCAAPPRAPAGAGRRGGARRDALRRRHALRGRSRGGLRARVRAGVRLHRVLSRSAQAPPTAASPRSSRRFDARPQKTIETHSAAGRLVPASPSRPPPTPRSHAHLGCRMGCRRGAEPVPGGGNVAVGHDFPANEWWTAGESNP